MPSLKVYDMSGKEIETISLSEDYFGIAPRKDIVSEAVLNELNNERRGTVKVKTRGEVSGGGKKPWNQKGTGRARQALHWFKLKSFCRMENKNMLVPD